MGYSKEGNEFVKLVIIDGVKVDVYGCYLRWFFHCY